MHKTGTTAIQMALNGMVHEAAKYAQLSHANHSVPLMTIFQKHPLKGSVKLKPLMLQNTPFLDQYNFLSSFL